MNSKKQFEAMVEALIIQQDQDLAREIFHNMVVEKSRQIYEELLAEEFGEEDSEEDSESDSEEDDTGDESEDDGASDEIGGDASDDFISDVEDDSEEVDDMGGDQDLEDRMVDVEDALAELKAEFEELLSQEESEEGHDFGAPEDEFGSEEDEFGGDEFGGDEFGGDDSEMGGGEFGKTSFGTDDEEDEFEMMNSMFEYVNKVSLPKHGDDGSNKKSVVAKKNDMGGTAANIVSGGESKSGGTKGGLLNPSTKEENFGNVNVPGNSKAPKLNNVPKGHGAEKKGTGESAPNKKSIVGSK